MRGLFGAIAADRHAAPSSRPPPRMIGEYQRAALPFARFDLGEVFLADKFRQSFGDRQQQGFRGSPAPHRLQLKAIAIALATTRYPAECIVTFEELVQGFQFLQRLGRERSAHIAANEASEPFAQGAGLICNFVQFARHRSRLQRLQCIRWNKLGLLQPLQETIAAVEPVNRCVDWRRDGVEEIEAE